MNKAPYKYNGKRKKKLSGPKIIIIVIAAVLLVAAFVITIFLVRKGSLPTWDELNSAAQLTEPMTEEERALTVHFIDVGQGDCILAQATTGETLLIDAGESGNEQTVIDYIRRYGDDTLEYVVATHPHSDHIGSMDDVINAFTVKNILMPRLTEENTPTTACYQDFLNAVINSGAKAIAAIPGYTFSFGEGNCTVLSPAEQSNNLNNMSVVLRLDWGESSFLFTGDAEKEVEKQILSGAYAEYLNVDVLKLGHHGSGTSSTANFLKAVTPRYGVISCGADNDYGHPHEKTILKLERLGTRVLRTDTMGSIRMRTNGKTITVETDRNG